LLLALTIGCKREETSPPDDVDPTSDAPRRHPGIHARRGRWAEHPGQCRPSDRKIQPAREREKPAEPQTRDAALVAVAATPTVP
jgi:hypothetical protein